MKFSFVSAYLSIKQFPEIDLPSFVILTGENGVGKSHFLQAVQNNKIAVPQEVRNASVASYTAETLVPNGSQPFSASSIDAEIQGRADHIRNWANSNDAAIRNIAQKYDLPISVGNNPITAFQKGKLPQFLSAKTEDEANAIVTEFKDAIDQLGNQYLQQHGYVNHPFGHLLSKMAEKLCKPILTLDLEDFLDPRFQVWNDTPAFNQQISKIFVQYNKAWQSAVLKGHLNGQPINDQEFYEEFVPPWKFLEDAFAAAKLPFSITRPAQTGETQFVAKLSNTLTGNLVDFTSLSSGEKTIMAFALCLYHAIDE